MVGDSEPTSTVDVVASVREGDGNWSLDAAESSIEFTVKHFWGLVAVHGRFGRFEGDGTVGPDGEISGRLVIDAASLTTKNRKRDEHLRSADFFDADHYPNVVVTVRDLVPTGPTALQGRAVMEAAGHEHEFEVSVAVPESGSGAVTLRCELVVDRNAYGMTWSPLGMAAKEAIALVTARFVRS